MVTLCGRALMIGGLALAGACSSGGGGGGGIPEVTTIFGSGVLSEEMRPVSGFANVSYFTEGALYIEQVVTGTSAGQFALVTLDADGSVQIGPLVPQEKQAVGESLLLRAEDNLLPYILTEVNGGVLELRTAPNTELEPTLPIDEFVLSAGGIGSIDVSDLSATELHVSLEGFGELSISGAVSRQEVVLRGFGSYEAGDLQSEEADVLVEAFVTATVRVSDLLVATVKNGGSVYYFGDPTVESTIIGKGTVEQIFD
jgi:hypothetical protein